MGDITSAKVGGKRRPGRPIAEKQDTQVIIRDILVAARNEFVQHGLNGARVDRIAESAGVNKRLLYHYIGNKEELYAKVLIDAYRDIRHGESKLQLDQHNPVEAMQRLVGFTFDHFRDNPWFIRLLSVENIHHAKFMSRLPQVRDLQSPIIDMIRDLLIKGETTGEFRTGVDALELYISIAGLSYFYFSNVHTLSVAFGTPLMTSEKLAERRNHAIDVTLGYLRPTTPLENK